MTKAGIACRAPSAALLAALALCRARADVPRIRPQPVRDPSLACTNAVAQLALALPEPAEIHLDPPTNGWNRCAQLAFDIVSPPCAPTNLQVLVFMKDWDHLWYQNIVPGFLAPGQRNHLRVDLGPQSADWQAQGHRSAWHLRALNEPTAFGLRIFGDAEYTGTCRVERVVCTPRLQTVPPAIRNVRATTGRVSCYRKFEVRFELPDRYVNPFDRRQIEVTATFTSPSGRTLTAHGFYARSFFRTHETTGERIRPQGRPYWAVRFSPSEPGLYRYVLHARDETGETRWGPGTFEAVPGDQPGFVRVSSSDPRYFEFDDGSFFYPVGHNIRSPFDTRMDSQFPWTHRWHRESGAYQAYFRDMQRAGENTTEIWCAPWSLGLEWSPAWSGYRGIGQFNMRHAWELDRIMEWAEKYGVYIMLTIHNHGKFGTTYDREWEFNPFNVANGGYLKDPEDYWTDPRALDAFRELMRYTIARWGYSTRILAWKLWNELDLTGSRRDGVHNYLRPEVVQWHAEMGDAVKAMDPYRHLVSTHVSHDYTKQNRDIIALPQMDFCPVDAYHGSSDPVHIVDLMKRTARFNNPYGKPVLITEFGGSSYGQGIRHLRETLHCGLWASVGLPVAGPPMFWWWQLIEEEGYYRKFAAFNRFAEGIDLRNPQRLPERAALTFDPQQPSAFQVECLLDARQATGWIYATSTFGTLEPATSDPATNVVLWLEGMETNGAPVEVEFWNTVTGEPFDRRPAEPAGERLRVRVPPFVRDVAFKASASTP